METEHREGTAKLVDEFLELIQQAFEVSKGKEPTDSKLISVLVKTFTSLATHAQTQSLSFSSS